VSARDVIRKVRDVRLVPPDDPAYLAAMAEQALAHRRFGPKEEQSATYRASGRVESAVRQWLGERVELLAERVLAADVLYEDERSYRPLYLELDAVQGSRGVPRRVFEVKFTSNLAAIRRGFGQVARSVRLLGTRWAIDGAVVLVSADRGGLNPTDPRVQDLRFVAADDLAQDSLPGHALLRIALSDLAPFLTGEEHDLVREARDEGDANVTARLERAARLDAGEQLPHPERAPRPGATISFGDGGEPGADEDSPFAILRGLAGREMSPADDAS
jgi:hypothetical protein